MEETCGQKSRQDDFKNKDLFGQGRSQPKANLGLDRKKGGIRIDPCTQNRF